MPGDHPRVCGEQPAPLRDPVHMPGSPPRVRGTVTMSTQLILWKGSPPRVRGTGFEIVFHSGSTGITPACAGNSGQEVALPVPEEDHPRVCGEQQTDAYERITGVGSPPRVRGTGLKSNEYCADYRITPACAGNSTRLLFFSLPTQDHPRVCGEQANSRFPPMSTPGSPPRVRGTAVDNLVSGERRGITPACAGNRLYISQQDRKSWDHPRVCGEQY